MKFLLFKRSTRYYFGLFLPWMITMTIATIGLVFLFQVVLAAREAKRKAEGIHFYSILYPAGTEVRPVFQPEMERLLRERFWLRVRGQTFVAYLTDFKRTSQFFPHLELPTENSVFVGHALFERLHLTGVHEISVGNSRLRVGGRLPPLGTEEDDILFVPPTLRDALLLFSHETEWIVRVNLSLEEMSSQFPGARVEISDDLIRSERLFWQLIERFLWVLNGCLLALILFFTFFSTLKMVQYRRQEYSLLFAMGISCRVIQRHIQWESFLRAASVTLGSIFVIRCVWDGWSQRFLGESIAWNWKIIPVTVLPLLLVTALAVYFSTRSLSEENLVLSIQGGRG